MTNWLLLIASRKSGVVFSCIRKSNPSDWYLNSPSYEDLRFVVTILKYIFTWDSEHAIGEYFSFENHLIHFWEFDRIIFKGGNLNLTKAMKNYKKSDTGMVILSVFIISTVILLIINFYNLVPSFARLVIAYIWLAEFLVLIGYVCFFHNIRHIAGKR